MADCLEADTLVIKTQNPRPAKFELWDDYGSPGERIASSDSRWSWKGNWAERKSEGRRPIARKTSSEKPAEASTAFEGTGAVIVGSYIPNGGKAEVWLDGKLDRVVESTRMKMPAKAANRFGTRSD